MKPADVILKRAESEIAAGRPWRAKEILRGTLASRADSVLLERYGRLLESMGDRYEAGKYLFLSGARAPDYAEAIEVFLSRTATRSEADLLKQFPSSVRRVGFDDLPPVVQDALRQRGVRPNRFSATVPTSPRSSSWRDRFTMVIGVLIVAFLVLALGLGVGVIGNWIIKLWRR